MLSSMLGSSGGAPPSSPVTLLYYTRVQVSIDKVGPGSDNVQTLLVDIKDWCFLVGS